jgi:hypothetical protein
MTDRDASGLSEMAEVYVDPTVHARRLEVAFESEYHHGARVFLEELPPDAFEVASRPELRPSFLGLVGVTDVAPKPSNHGGFLS